MSTATARPTRIRLRPWQSAALDAFTLSDRPDFLAVATPGAGKTTFALTAATQEMAEHAGTRLIVVAPTRQLKYQWADAALRFGLHLEPDWSARDGNLPADMHGIVTTYQQVATSATALAGFARGAVVVFDEIHHAADDRTWGESILTAFGSARRRLSLSGTPFRSDTSAIPFVDYHLDEARADFEYGYGEALADGGVVRPVYFPRINGFMEWVAPTGETIAATFEDELPRELANQRLRTALSLEGEWLPTVVEQAHNRLMSLRRTHTDAGGLIIATDQEHAQAIADLLRQRHGVRAVVAVSDDPSASHRIAEFADSDEPWIVAVRMVSEGVDIPRLRIAVFATTTTTELFFRQAVGRVARWTRGVRNQKAYFFVPDDARLRLYASQLADSRRHSLRRRSSDDDGQLPDNEPALDDVALDDDEQMSLFAVIGAVAIVDGDHEGGHDRDQDDGVFGEDPDGDPDDGGGAGVDLVLLPPPLPGGGLSGGRHDAESAGDPHSGHPHGGGELDPRRRRIQLRDANADIARELVHATGWSHPQVNAELNRLSGIRRISEASVEQLQRRLDAGRKWLRSA